LLCFLFLINRAMLKITEVKPNLLIELEGRPYQVLSAAHQMLGRGYGMTRAKLKDLKSGAIIERVFKGNETIKEVSLEKIKAFYLWQKEKEFHFIDVQGEKEFILFEEQVGFLKNFLKEGERVEILFFQDEPLLLNLPVKMAFKVVETEPGIRGDRETPGTKRAKIETGFEVRVPLFVKEGEIILVDTRDGSYVGRAK